MGCKNMGCCEQGFGYISALIFFSAKSYPQVVICDNCIKHSVAFLMAYIQYIYNRPVPKKGGNSVGVNIKKSSNSDSG